MEEKSELQEKVEKGVKEIGKQVEKGVKEIEENVEAIEKKVEQGTKEAEHHIKQVGLAILGGIALAQDEFEKFIKKLIERGKKEENPLDTVGEFFEKRYKKSMEIVEEIAKGFNTKKALSEMKINSNEELEKLAQKVDQLTSKIDSIQKKDSE